MRRSVHWFIKAAAMLGLAVAIAGPAEAGINLVQNGNFGTGDYSSWTLAGDSSGAYISSGQLNGSTYQAALTTNADDNGFLRQTIATTVGQMYTYSFLLGGDGATTNSFSASLGGSTLVNLTNIPYTLPAGTTYSGSYTATSSSSVLSFTFDDAPGYLYLTNVSVMANPTTVPEPSTIVGVGTGVLMLTGFFWGRSRRSPRTRIPATDGD